MVDVRTKKAVDILNHILETELAGAIHYTHYSFNVMLAEYAREHFTNRWITLPPAPFAY